MNDRPDGRQDLQVGLCSVCRHGRVIRSDRGARFWLCERSRTDPMFPKFPPLPVRACAGFEPAQT